MQNIQGAASTNLFNPVNSKNIPQQPSVKIKKHVRFAKSSKAPYAKEIMISDPPSFDEDKDCICNRGLSSLLCTSCQKIQNGRLRKTCPKHPNVSKKRKKENPPTPNLLQWHFQFKQ